MTADFELQPGAHHLDLAQSPEFDLGALHVSPAHRRVTADGRSWDLEPRVMSVLVVLAAGRPKVVSRDQLVQTCWGGRIVGDDAVNRCILSLRNLARSLTPEPFRIETVRGVGYCLVASSSAQPPPSDDLDATIPAAESRIEAKRRTRALTPVLLVLLGVVATVLAWAGWSTLRPASSSVARVEVAPFQSLGAGDPDLARVSQATRGALARVLGNANIPIVEAPTPGANSAPSADYHVNGAVDRDGDAMVINVRVLDRARRNVLWSSRLERPLSAQARFPDQAANRIGDVLLCALRSRSTSNRPMTDAVLSLVMQACEFRRPSLDEAPRLLAAAERLRAAAPQLSAAQSMYAVAVAAKSILSPEAPEAAALAKTARAAAHRALQLDPKNGEAYFAIGISYGFDHAWAEREANFLRAEALSNGYGISGDLHVGLLREVGRIREARELSRRTVADNPFGPEQFFTLVILTAAADGREAAEPLLQQLRLVVPPNLADKVRLTTTFWWDDPKAARSLLAGMKGDAAVDKRCFQAYLASLEPPPPRHGLPDSCRTLQADWRVRMLAREGDIDGAYRETDQAKRRGASVLMAFYYPEMRAFRADPRFMPLAARYGLVDYWTRSGHWPDFCGEPDLPFDCATEAARVSPR